MFQIHLIQHGHESSSQVLEIEPKILWNSPKEFEVESSTAWITKMLDQMIGVTELKGCDKKFQYLERAYYNIENGEMH